MTEQIFTQHVAHLVSKLFRRQAPTAIMAVQGGSARAVEPAPDTDWQSQPVIASRLHMIGLAKVRASLGDRWAALAKDVLSIAQSILDKHILPGDICEQHGEDGFLVLFSQLSPGEAKFKSDAISREIEKRLISENFAHVSDCVAEVRVLGSAESFLSPQLITAETVEDYGRDGGVQPPTSLRRKSDADSRDASFSRGDATHPNRRVGSFRSDENSPRSSSTPLRRASDRDSEPNPDSEKTAASKPAVTAELITKPTRRHTDIEWVYRPVWDFKNATLITFALYPKQTQPPAELDQTADETVLECDTAAVWKCVHDLQGLSASGRRLPLLTRIQHATIDNARRRAFFSGTVRTIPPEFRKLISFEIVGCPQGGLTFGICSFISGLRSSGVRIALRVDSKWPDFLAIEGAGAQMVAMDTFDESGPESERMTSFEIFAARAANAKLEAGMWGLGTRSLVVAAASAGIRYLAGGAVAPEIVNISHAFRFSPIDLYPRP